MFLRGIYQGSPDALPISVLWRFYGAASATREVLTCSPKVHKTNKEWLNAALYLFSYFGLGASSPMPKSIFCDKETNFQYFSGGSD